MQGVEVQLKAGKALLGLAKRASYNKWWTVSIAVTPKKAQASEGTHVEGLRIGLWPVLYGLCITDPAFVLNLQCALVLTEIELTMHVDPSLRGELCAT